MDAKCHKTETLLLFGDVDKSIVSIFTSTGLPLKILMLTLQPLPME